MMNDLLNLIAFIIIVGVLMWLINTYIPMASAIKSLLNILVLIIMILYVLQYIGVIAPIMPTVNILPFKAH